MAKKNERAVDINGDVKATEQYVETLAPEGILIDKTEELSKIIEENNSIIEKQASEIQKLNNIISEKDAVIETLKNDVNVIKSEPVKDLVGDEFKKTEPKFTQLDTVLYPIQHQKLPFKISAYQGFSKLEGHLYRVTNHQFRYTHDLVPERYLELALLNDGFANKPSVITTYGK